MYKSFFGLKANPFNVNPDPRFLFVTQHTREALACLAYGIQNRKGFMLLTGEVGTGKTTILNKLLEWLHTQRISSAFIFNPKLEVIQFFDFMLADFGIPCRSRDKSQFLLKLNQWLLERYRAREAAVLIVDEAQNLSAEMLEEIRLLTNLETSTEKLLQIVLSGQPELEQKLKLPELRQLRQRIRFTALKPMPCRVRKQVRTSSNGWDCRREWAARSFEPGAVERVHKYSQGIPRVINLLCEHSLINSFVGQERPVSPEIVEEVCARVRVAWDSADGRWQGATTG